MTVSEVSDLGGAAASTAAGARTTPPARRGREGADADAARRQAMMAESDRVYAVAQGAVPGNTFSTWRLQRDSRV